jgi:HSP20 family molecular chaperone IbpA
MSKKRSFFERLTGNIRMKDDDDDTFITAESESLKRISFSDKGAMQMDKEEKKESAWEEEEEAQLTVDVYQTPSDIVIQTMVAGVQPEHLSITITRSMIIIRGKREENRAIAEDSYFVQELYWGSFSRTISLPEEVDPEEADAVEKHGLLTIKLPKIDKDRETKLKVKSI